MADATATVVVTYDDSRFDDARDVAEYLHEISVERGDGVSDVSSNPMKAEEVQYLLALIDSDDGDPGVRSGFTFDVAALRSTLTNKLH